MMLFEKVAYKLSQCVALIDEEIPRFKQAKELLHQDTIKLFVLQTRCDIEHSNDAIDFIEKGAEQEYRGGGFFSSPKPVPLPNWLAEEAEYTDAELEEELEALADEQY